MGKENLKKEIIAALRKVYDPEIAVSVYDLGLIYEIAIDDDNNVDIVMTLTTPNCPVAETFPIEIETAVRKVEKTKDVQIHVTFEPPWEQSMMSDEAKLELGFMLDL